MTPNELYARTPQVVERDDFYYLKGCYYDHLPEVDVNAPELDEVLRGPLKDRFELRFYRRHNYDVRRVWWLYSLWLDGNPIMILQNAGREGDDHHRRIITDPELFAQAVSLIHSHLSVPILSDVLSPYIEVEGLNNFYGDRLEPNDGQ